MMHAKQCDFILLHGAETSPNTCYSIELACMASSLEAPETPPVPNHGVDFDGRGAIGSGDIAKRAICPMLATCGGVHGRITAAPSGIESAAS
jgi:hypothetical protein